MKAYKTDVVSKQDAKRPCSVMGLKQNSAQKKRPFSGWPHLGQFYCLRNELLFCHSFDIFVAFYATVKHFFFLIYSLVVSLSSFPFPKSCLYGHFLHFLF